MGRDGFGSDTVDAGWSIRTVGHMGTLMVLEDAVAPRP